MWSGSTRYRGMTRRVNYAFFVAVVVGRDPAATF